MLWKSVFIIWTFLCLYFQVLCYCKEFTLSKKKCIQEKKAFSSKTLMTEVEISFATSDYFIIFNCEF